MAGRSARRAGDARAPRPLWGPEETLNSLREAYRLLQKQRIGILARFDLSLSEYFALRLCREAPAMPSDIAAAAGVTAAGATDIIDRLEQRKLVRRVSHPNDRRAVLVALTPSGKRFFEEARAAQRVVTNDLGRTMTESEREALVRGLKALVRSLPSIPAEGDRRR